MTESVLSNERECLRCKTTQNLHVHHIFNGAYRKKSEKYGYWCYLCFECHVGSRGVHTTIPGRHYWNTLKGQCQEDFEKTHTREEFIKVFGQNYL